MAWPGPKEHPVFPWRRRFVPPRETLLSNGAWVPPLADRAAAFEAMPSARAPGPTDGLVVCRVHVKARFDQLRDSDLRARLIVGGDRYFDFWGPEDSDVSFFSIPRMSWKAGDALELSAEDRDVTGAEEIGTARATHDGTMPVSFEHPNVSTECRMWTGEVVEAKAQALAKRTSELLSAARERLTPAPGAPEWGHPRSGIPEVWSTLDELTAHVGLDDPRVRALGAELEKLEAEWEQKVARSMAAEVARLPPLSSKAEKALAGAAVVVEAVVCGEAPPAAAQTPLSRWKSATTGGAAPCFLRVGVTRTAPASDLFVFPGRVGLVQLILADGSEVGTTEIAVLDARGTAQDVITWKPAPGERYTVLVGADADVAIGAHPGSAPANVRGPVKLVRFRHAPREDASSLARIDG